MTRPTTIKRADAPARKAAGTAADPGNNLLELCRVGKRFDQAGEPSGANPVPVLQGIDLTLRSDQVIGVVGESGSGKTTLGRLAAGLLDPSEGSVRINGVDLAAMAPAARRQLRRDVRVIFQSPSAALNPFLRVRDLCEEPLRVHQPDLGPAERRARVESMAATLGFGGLDQYPRSLSGGEKRRASLVRALAVPSKLLVADEPTSGLDSALEVQILRIIEEHRRAFGAGMLLISHHLGIVERLAHMVVVLFSGRMVERAEVDRSGFRGLHPYSQALWEAARLEGDGDRRQIPPAEPEGPAVSRGCPYSFHCALRPRLSPAIQRRCFEEEPLLRPVASGGGPGHASGPENDGPAHWVACHETSLQLAAKRVFEH